MFSVDAATGAGSDAVQEFEVVGFEGVLKTAGSPGAREVLGIAVKRRICVLVVE